MNNHKNGEVTLAALLVVALVGASALWLSKPRKLDGESRRADAGIEATAQLEAAHKAELAAKDAQAATAAASVAQIGVAAGDVPDSPAADFIRREVPVAASLLPKPDPAALLAAERRRIAVMEGRLAEVDRLYRAAYADAQKRGERVVAAERERDKALADRAEADRAISEVAAANLALERRSRQQWALVGLLGTLAVFLWFNGVSPAKIGRALADIRAGNTPGEAFGNVLPEWMHARVQRAARVAVPSEDPKRNG